MINLIGIHGPLNGGKDTVASIIHELCPFGFRNYAFAKPLKEAAKILFGFTQEQLEDRVLKEAVDPYWEFTPRRALQLMGTDFARDMLRKDVWIKRAQLEVHNNLKTNYGTIITDVRFENEAEWVRSLKDAALIYLEVPGLVKDERYQHASEAGISRDEADYVIVNDKSKGLKVLKAQVQDVLDAITWKHGELPGKSRQLEADVHYKYRC